MLISARAIKATAVLLDSHTLSVLITSDSAAAVSIDILATRHIQGETCSLYLRHKVVICRNVERGGGIVEGLGTFQNIYVQGSSLAVGFNGMAVSLLAS